MTNVDRVNNSTNTTLYTAGGAAVGAAAGGAFGYFSKPHWNSKEETVSDKFIKSFEKNVANNAETKASYEKMVAMTIENSKTTNNMINFLRNLTDSDFEKNAIEQTREKLINIANSSGVLSAEELAGVKADLSTSLVNKASVEQIISDISLEAKASILSKHFDNDGKIIAENTKDGIGAVVKKTVGNVKLKTAALYGAIGAAVVGFLVWAFAGGSKENAIEALKKDISESDD